MSRPPAEILREALELPDDARAALADSLLESLDTEVDRDAEDFWKAEILRRAKELDEGLVTPIPWNDVRKRLLEICAEGADMHEG